MILFKDNSVAPIIAIDFDGTINIDGEDTYPECGHIRPYAKEVLQLLHDVGVKIVIWTSRDVAYNQGEGVMYDHLTPMINFLEENDVRYDAINKSIQFSPYHYNGRKIYAHMYVDDRAYGWKNNGHIMIDVMSKFLSDVCGVYDNLMCNVTYSIRNLEHIEDKVIRRISDQVWNNWNRGDR